MRPAKTAKDKCLVLYILRLNRYMAIRLHSGSSRLHRPPKGFRDLSRELGRALCIQNVLEPGLRHVIPDPTENDND